jgi:hypothetical protein
LNFKETKKVIPKHFGILKKKKHEILKQKFPLNSKRKINSVKNKNRKKTYTSTVENFDNRSYVFHVSMHLGISRKNNMKFLNFQSIFENWLY